MTSVALSVVWLMQAGAADPSVVARRFVATYLKQPKDVAPLDGVPKLSPFLSRRLSRLLQDAAACQADWIKKQPKGSSDKPPFVDCCLFASNPEGLPTSFELGPAEAMPDGRVRQFVDYSYAEPPGTYADKTIPLRTYKWRDALVLANEQGSFRVDDFVFMRDAGKPEALSESFRSCAGPRWRDRPAGQEFGGRDKLRAQSDEFRRDVIRLTERVHVAVGYSASNVTLIRGEGAAIVVDTGSDPSAARETRAAFGSLLDSPLRAIVYTHGHPDHTGGANVWAGGDNPDIYSHQLLVDGPPDISRGLRDGGDQFGMSLPDSLYINAGVQLQYGRSTPPTREGYLRPTRTFGGSELELTIAGVPLQLLHTPGETRENVAVWLPDERVLMAGDDFYRAFPNLYPIRGGRLRAPEPWVASLETMLALGAEHLVPGHTRPISGAANVRAALTAYRDALQSVLDQTLAGMQKGERPDELVQHVKLPAHLVGNPYLQEFYGSVAWCVRAIYADRLGWFDGNATRLFPLPERERAAKIVELAGGPEQVLARARDALAAREFQWAAELADYVLAVDGASSGAKRIKAQALAELGERQINANARNYYLSAAQYLLRDLPRMKGND
jgi:glyoxylase-like metal-dependent hydrolase (beta-lactamase superfamily II)